MDRLDRRFRLLCGEISQPFDALRAYNSATPRAGRPEASLPKPLSDEDNGMSRRHSIPRALRSYLAYGAGKAHDVLNLARKAGKIKPPTDFECVDCGKPATEYDHRDCNRPLDVEPVCHSCNTKRGAAIPLRHAEREALGCICSNTGIQRVRFEVVDFYPEFDDAVRYVSDSTDDAPLPQL